MHIREWIAQSGKTHFEVAELFGVKRFTLRSWLYGGKVPKPETMLAVYEATGSAVKLSDWVRPVA